MYIKKIKKHWAFIMFGSIIFLALIDQSFPRITAKISDKTQTPTAQNKVSPVQQNNSDAVKKLNQDAKQGDATAQLDLGVMNYGGKGMAQDYTEAMKWLRLSAEQGNDQAQYDVGYMYNFGQGVAQDYVEAGKWYARAAAQRNDFTQSHSGFFSDPRIKQGYSDSAKELILYPATEQAAGEERLEASQAMTRRNVIVSCVLAVRNQSNSQSEFPFSSFDAYFTLNDVKYLGTDLEKVEFENCMNQK